MKKSLKTTQFQAYVEGISSRKDRTLKITLGTQELSKEDTAQLFDYANDLVWCALSETPMTDEDLNIPEALTEFKTDKTPSQRLRGVLYRFWEQNHKGKVEWEVYYRTEMEKIINYLKDKLE